MDITEEITDRERLVVLDAEYDVESEGHRIDTPVVHLFCRNEDGQRRDIQVEGFRPYFLIDADEFRETYSDVLHDRRVLGVELDCSTGDWSDCDYIGNDTDNEDRIADELSAIGDATVYHTDDPTTDLHENDLVRIIVRTPGGVGGNSGKNGLRDHFESDHEADIPFVRRFLISTEIYRGASVPDGATRVRYENWDGESNSETRLQEIEPCDPPDSDPRVLTLDIEVATQGEGFPDANRAKKPIIAISTHDSYTDQYRAWILESDQWDDTYESDTFDESIEDEIGIEAEEVHVFDDETFLLESFHQYVVDHRFDFFTGWNSSRFDLPYLIQRSYNVNARSIVDWCEIGNPAVWASEYGGNRSIDFSLKGPVTLDMLEAYKKTQFRELSSYRLEDVARAELDIEKLELDTDNLDEAWHQSPVEFLAYNVRDVEAVVGIEQSSGLIDLYDNMREVTGARYNTCNNNGPMLDTLFLRRAYEQGLALPTNVEPEQGKYHGARVFDPVPGVHDNCVYPDLSSLYPALFSMLNLGQETIIGDEESFNESEYTEDQVFVAPIDRREFKTVPKGESYSNVDRDRYKGVLSAQGGVREMFDPQFEDMYVLKPDVKESFVRETIDELIELKYEYSGDKYEAVKRVTNSVYGVTGDSESGGKGFRLFDRRIAEGITLAGRQVITYTANEFTDYLRENYDDEAYIVGGDTDSATTSIPSAPDLQTALDWAMDAVEHVDASYDEFAEETFGLDPDEDENRLAVELESLASALFYPQDVDADLDYRQNAEGYIEREDEQATKKRYAQHVVWDEDDGWIDTAYEEPDDPEDRSTIKYQDTVTLYDYEDGAMSEWDPTDFVSITGFEYVRSDSSIITQEAQERILTDALLAPDYEDRIYDYLTDLVDRIESGDVPIWKLGRPKGVRNPLDDYGWADIDDLDEDEITDEVEEYGGMYRATPGPTYRGRKYADDHFPWEDHKMGSKPTRFYVDQVRAGDYPQVYTYDSYPEDDRPDSPEIGREVDAIAVEFPDQIPDEFVMDREKMMKKELEEKVDSILETVDLSWDGIVVEGRQSELTAWT